jgi:hypothetical protein
MPEHLGELDHVTEPGNREPARSAGHRREQRRPSASAPRARPSSGPSSSPWATSRAAVMPPSARREALAQLPSPGQRRAPGRAREALAIGERDTAARCPPSSAPARCPRSRRAPGRAREALAIGERTRPLDAAHEKRRPRGPAPSPTLSASSARARLRRHRRARAPARAPAQRRARDPEDGPPRSMIASNADCDRSMMFQRSNRRRR